MDVVDSAADVTEEDVVEAQGEEETIPVRAANSPETPSTKAFEEHREKGHIPHRDWCKFCIEGRGLTRQHRPGEPSVIPVVGLDYFYISAGGVQCRRELAQEEIADGEAAIQKERLEGSLVKCLLMRCFSSKALFAHCIPYKGTGEDQYVATVVTKNVEWLGHTRLILKCDNEPSLKALVEQSLEEIRIKVKGITQISVEHPPRYESQSNGGIETGVRIIRGQFRTLKLCLEARLGKIVPVNHALIPWLLEYTALLITVRYVGTDGRTAWCRARGRNFRMDSMNFAELILYKLPMKGPLHDPDGNMGAQWAEAIFLGYSRFSNTFIVYTSAGINTARTLRRRPESERWSSERLAQVTATPWSIYERPAVQVRFREAAAPSENDLDSQEQPVQLRNMRINKDDLDQYGYTEGCIQCNVMRRTGKAAPGRVHTASCRSRIIEAIGQTDAGKHRIAQYDERLTEAMARHIERADRSLATTPVPAPTTFLPAAADEILSPPPGPSSASSSTQRPSVQLRTHHESVRAPRSTAIAHETTPREEMDTAENFDDEMMGGDEEPLTNDDRMLSAAQLAMCKICQNGPSVPLARLRPKRQGIRIAKNYSSNPCRHDPSREDAVTAMLWRQLGAVDHGIYPGDLHSMEEKGGKQIVTEIYSPPRITEEVRRSGGRHLVPGIAFDITVNDPDDGQPWDFNIAAKRAKAREIIRRQRPYMLIGSPMCTAFSTWQFLNTSRSKDPVARRRALAQATMHMRFVVELYEEQVQGGRYFLHEHPRYATSWSLPEMELLMKTPGVELAHADQCQYGAEVAHGHLKGSPIKKPTCFLSNSPNVLKMLSRRCEGTSGECSRSSGGRHSQCTGRIAKEAAIYPRGLCQAVVKGITEQLMKDKLIKQGCFGVQLEDDEEEIRANCQGPEQGFSGRFRDDLTGQLLNDELVLQARRVELQFFNKKGVWRKVPLEEARRRTGRPPISTRWVDVNKGDEQSPNYRSRLVARQMKAHDHSGVSYFAPAPPLEALRTVISMAVTEIGSHKPILDPMSPHRSQISSIDVKRAYFNAVIDERDPPTFVSLPKEDEDQSTMCALLLRHMYGTRMAADGWQQEYSTLLIRLGFRQGTASPNLFYNRERTIMCTVHGDDFTSQGPCNQLEWFEKAVAEHYEITVGPRIGPGPSDEKEVRVLNRVIRWTDAGVEYEADPRQAERLMAECGLEQCQSVATPGVRPTGEELASDEALPHKLTTPFRGSSARASYLSSDRIDAQFACKEVCRSMSKPTVSSWKALKRVCRFLHGRPRLVYVYPVQKVDHIDVYTDTDWAGCPRTRKSTSGGSILLGRHTIKHWSSTQTSTALSSAEAEFGGVLRGSGQGLGYQALLSDLGVEVPLRVWTDSSAAIGICQRQGLGKVRHLDTQTLWIQQAVRAGKVDLRKVAGESNPADLLTKHSLTQARMEMLVQLHGCRYTEGRAESAPMTRKGGTTKATMASAVEGLNALEAFEMPHVQYSEAELNRRYPRLEVPEEELLDSSHELRADQDDAVLQHGLKIAKEVRSAMAEVGRIKYEPNRPATGPTGGHGPGHSKRRASRTLPGGVTRSVRILRRSADLSPCARAWQAETQP